MATTEASLGAGGRSSRSPDSASASAARTSSLVERPVARFARRSVASDNSAAPK